MKCQECGQPATQRISEIVERQLCDRHAELFLGTNPELAKQHEEQTLFQQVWSDGALAEALHGAAGRERFVAHLLPALCRALLDGEPSVQVRAIFRLMLLGREVESAIGALRDALGDPDQLVRKAAQLALQRVEAQADNHYLLLF